MKYIITFLVIFAIAPVAYAAYGSSNTVETSVVSTTSVTGASSVKASSTAQEGSTDALLEIDTIKGGSPEPKKGNVEMQWKVEEGQKSTAIEPDEIDVADDSEPITPDFGILLGGGGEGGDEELTEEEREEIAEILKEGAEKEGLATEQISLNFEKIQVNVSQEVKLLGFIPLSANATVEIDEENEVKVKFPWWATFASGKNKNELGDKVFTTLSNVLKTKHDTVKNSIGNVR